MKNKLVVGLSIVTLLSSACLTSCAHKYEHKYLPTEIAILDSKGREQTLTIFNYENKYRNCSIANFNIVDEERFETFLINIQYNDFGLLEFYESIENDENGVFNRATKYEYVYNNNNLISIILTSYKDEDSPVYVLGYKENTEYDQYGNILLTQDYKYNPDTKLYSLIESCSYLYDGLLNLSEKNVTDEFGNQYRTLIYTENGKDVIVYSSKPVGANSYTNLYKEETATISTDNGHKKTVTNIYTYPNESWVLDSYHSLEYDSNNNIVLDEYKSFVDGSLSSGFKEECTYGKHGQITNDVIYIKEVGDPDYLLEQNDKYLYDESNKLYKIEHYNTDDVLDSFDLYTLDNKGNIGRIEYFNCLNDSEFVLEWSYSIKYKNVTTLSNMYEDFTPFDYI